MLTYDILEVDDALIANEGMMEVTSSKLFLNGIDPDPNGLASYDIFGVPGTEARKKRFGYIKLNCTIIHPHVHNDLKSCQRLFDDVIYGREKAYIHNGQLIKYVEGEPSHGDVGTGVKFLKRNWKLLNFNEPDAVGDRRNRLRFIRSLTEKQIFVDKILVLPAYYRDVDMRSGAKKNEWEGVYVRLINLANTLSSNTDLFALMDDGVSDVERQIIDVVGEMYETIISMFGRRKGFMHKYVMGKTIDYSARLVISGPNTLSANKPSEMPTQFDRSLVPLHVVAKCFTPYMINRIRALITDFMSGYDYVADLSGGTKKDGLCAFKDMYDRASRGKEQQPERVVQRELASDWRSVLSAKNIEKMIELYHESQEHRLDIFKLPAADGTEVPMTIYCNEDVEDNTETSFTDLKKYKGFLAPLRLVQLFYIAAKDIVQDKHVLITRFPIQDQNNTYPSKINIMAYKNTKRLLVGDTVYNDFPVVDYENDIKKISSMFSDSLTLCAAYLESLGGDYDGDQVSLIPLFTREANADADKFIRSRANLAGISGGTIKSLGKLYQQTIYCLTN